MPRTTSRAPEAAENLHREVQHRDHHVHALDGEPFLSEVGLVEELLEILDLGEPGQEFLLLLGRQRLPMRAGLDDLAEPDSLFVTRDVFDFDAIVPQ